MLVPFALLALAVPQQQPFENPCANGYTENVWDPRFAPGQQWSYRNRPIDQGSTFIVTKIDDVPGIGAVIQVDVLDVDLVDEPGTPRPRNNPNPSRVSIAIRRDALDASALQMLKIAQTVVTPQYRTWRKNCGGLTYSTTLADSIQAEHEAYLARMYTSVLSFAAIQTPSGRHVTFTLSLTANRQPLQPVPEFLGHLTSKDGTPVKDAVIDLEAKNLQPIRALSLSSPQTLPQLRTATDGSFSLPFLDPSIVYSLKVTLNGFEPVLCIVKIFHNGRVEISRQR